MRSVVEPLEQRRLLTAEVFTATGNGDALFVAYDSANQQYTFSGGVNTPTATPVASFTGVGVFGTSGTATLSVLSTAPGQPLALISDAGADGAAVSLVVSPGASLILDTTQHLSALTIGQGATVQLPPSGFDTLVTESLQFAGTTMLGRGRLT